MICFSFHSIPITPSNQLKENRISDVCSIQMVQKSWHKRFATNRSRIPASEYDQSNTPSSVAIALWWNKENTKTEVTGHIKGPYLVKTTLFIPKKYENVKIVKLNSL